MLDSVESNASEGLEFKDYNLKTKEVKFEKNLRLGFTILEVSKFLLNELFHDISQLCFGKY